MKKRNTSKETDVKREKRNNSRETDLNGRESEVETCRKRGRQQGRRCEKGETAEETDVKKTGRETGGMKM